MKPLFTIATVTYNAESTLGRTLKSVASQDYARIEHLIIDGCSTDHTLSLVQRYVEENQARHNIRLVCEPDRKSTRLNSSHLSTSRMPSSA